MTAKRTALAALFAIASMSLWGRSEPLPCAATFGGRLQLPGGAVFAPTVYDRYWKAHGGIGSATAFRIECGAGAAENVTDGALAFACGASFEATPEGAVAASWSATPESDGSPAEVCVFAKYAKAELSAVVADGETLPIRDGIPPKPRLLEKPLTSLRLLGPDGSPSLDIAFPSPTRVLVQDNEQWGKSFLHIRLYMAVGDVKEGVEYTVSAVFSRPGAAFALAPDTEITMAAGDGWIPYPAPPAGADWIEPGSALDLSATVPHHEPAGKFGRVVVKGDHFELEDRPGEQIRFCGANIVHNANIPDPASVDRFCENLARMGYNSVRIHHHDPFLASPGTPPCGKGAAKPDKDDPGALSVPPEAWERFDALVAACIRHGLYITTDIFVSRNKAILPSALGLEGDALSQFDYKTLVAFHEPAASNLLEWTRVFLGHVNPHTGRSLAEEPALASLAVVNEGNLGNYGINRLKQTRGVAEAWRAWLAAHPEFGFKPDAPIPDEIYDASGRRKDVAAFARFLADSEQRLFDRVAAVVRDELGCKAPLSSLSGWYYPEQYLRPLSSFDYIDNHFYVEHPVFVGRQWRFPSAITGGNPFASGQEVPGAVWRRIFGKPSCITEWNWAAPMGSRSASGLVVGALAALQDWSGIWRFAWSHNHEGVEAPGSLPMRYFDMHSDPVQRASEYATVALYLRGDMAPLPAGTERAREWDMAQVGAPGKGGAMRLGEALPGVSPWECRVGTALRSGGADRGAAAAPAEVETHGAEPNRADGTFSVVTERTCGGFAESGALECGPLHFDIADSGEAQSAAAIWATSIDGAPLATSQRILVAHVTDARNTGAVFDGPEAHIWQKMGSTPALLRRGRAEISLLLAADPGSNVTIYRLSPTGHRLSTVPSSIESSATVRSAPAHESEGARCATVRSAPAHESEGARCATVRSAPAHESGGARCATVRVSFTADTAYDPDCATLFYEIVRNPPAQEGAAVVSGRQALWPEGAMPDRQEHQIAAMTDEADAPGFDRAAHAEPYLEWFDPPSPAASNGVCAILISGGAYQNCCDVGLVRAWRDRLTALGCQCVSLVYRTPRPKGLPIHQSAWEDGQRAVRLVRSQAAARGFDPEKIVTFSMSAGSHLATLLAVSSQTPAYAPVDAIDETPCHVNAAVVFAVAYGLSDGAGHPNLREGDGPDILLDPAFAFDEKTAPMCLLHGGADIYSPLASTRIYRELRKRKVPAEVHLFPDKGHGAHGVERGIEFLRAIGVFGDPGAEVPLMDRYADDSARAAYEKQPVWPAGKMPSVQTNQCEPFLEWHIPTNLATRAVQMIWSGGSYMGNGPGGFEVAPARRFLNEKGMAVVTVRYRTPRPAAPLAKHVTAWQDVQRAIRLVRSQAAARGLDPDRIGIMGSSAGGHLALMAATSSRHRAYRPIDDLDRTVPCNVQWAVCIYPAYAMTDGLEKCNAGGGNDLDTRLAPEFSFDPDTPPMLFVHGDADGWAAMNSVAAWEQLRRMGLQGEVHTLAKRQHCFQRAAVPGTGSYTYLDRIWEFLRAKGFAD